MEKGKFVFFTECVEQAFGKVLALLTALNLTQSEPNLSPGSKTISVIIGITGRNKGRILLEVDDATALKITEGMNDGPLDSELELYLFLAEFANIFSGNAITRINNTYKGSELRLIPPAIFAGDNLEITTPHIDSSDLWFTGDGNVRVNVGFEGV